MIETVEVGFTKLVSKKKKNFDSKKKNSIRNEKLRRDIQSSSDTMLNSEYEFNLLYIIFLVTMKANL